MTAEYREKLLPSLVLTGEETLGVTTFGHLPKVTRGLFFND